ncbi:MAG: four helix bundle protein [Chitinophagaceae bacterium]|nr:four helix bundle protein [Chitinophagaceae bacterium]
MDEGFEDLELNEDGKPYNIRHRCYYFSRDLILFVKDCVIERVYSSLFDQVIRSGTSIGANLVEGKSGVSSKDWLNYFGIALKSANETKYWLYLIRDTMNVSNKKTDELIKEADEISKIIASIIINKK